MSRPRKLTIQDDTHLFEGKNSFNSGQLVVQQIIVDNSYYHIIS